jgi:predicted amidohydrolase
MEMPMRGLRLALAQYEPGFFSHWREYVTKVSAWVQEAVGNGAELLVFPEYGSLELVSLLAPEQRRDFRAELAGMQVFHDPFCDLFGSLALRHGCHVLAPSFPWRAGEGGLRNRVYLFSPSGGLGFQDKLMLTRFEREATELREGDRLQVFDTRLGRLGVLICYDSEFPLLARRCVEAGAELLLVPSCNGVTAGYHQVRLACRARALENQCFVAQSSLVGQAPWLHWAGINVGAAGCYAPPDEDHWPDGVVAQGVPDLARWLFVDLDPAKVAEPRRRRDDTHVEDWDRQEWAAAPVAALETLP